MSWTAIHTALSALLIVLVLGTSTLAQDLDPRAVGISLNDALALANSEARRVFLDLD